MDSAFVRFGHGYETGSRGRCEAFDGFTIIANPLGGFAERDREARHWPRAGGLPGTTYGSHAIWLAVRDSEAPHLESSRPIDLFILMHHGGGREVLRVPGFHDGGALRAAILAMPEREQYALLYSIWRTASPARGEAQQQTANKYAEAFAEGRLKKKRRAGAVRVEIAPRVQVVAPAPIPQTGD